jgi:hypothetical protein
MEKHMKEHLKAQGREATSYVENLVRHSKVPVLVVRG